MNTLTNRPYLLFFLVIPFILIFSFLKPKETFDINIKDTYFVILNLHLGILLSTVYLILGIIYLFLSKKGIILKEWVTYSHSIISVAGLILIWLLLKRINNNQSQNFEEILKSIKTNQYMIYTCVITFSTMIIVQFIFIINVIIKVTRNILN